MAYSNITLAEIESQLTERVGNNTTFWTSEEKRDAINEALSVWQALTGQWVTSFPWTPVMEQGNFAKVPQQVVSLQRLTSTAGPLTLSSLQELDQGMVGWQDASASTPSLWAPVGLNYVALSPIPDRALTAYGITPAPRLQSQVDYVNIGQEDLNRLLDYAQWYLTFKEGPSESVAMDAGFTAMVEAAVHKNTELKATAFYRKYMGPDRNVSQRPRELPATPGAR